MRLTYDSAADAAYLYLTDKALEPGRDTTGCTCPDGVRAMVNLDWKGGRLVGLEVLSASSLLFSDLLTEHANPTEYGEWPYSVVIGTMGIASVRISMEPDKPGDFCVAIQNYGMKVSACIRSIEGNAAAGMADFVNGLVADWRGWDGERVWKSETVEEQLTVTARSGATGTITLTFALSEPELGWAASTEVFIGAGEELRRFAGELADLLGDQEISPE